LNTFYRLTCTPQTIMKTEEGGKGGDGAAKGKQAFEK
jgi:hypothetical protein